ncbi:Aspartic proteinase nepenthesin-1 [Sesamum alatum]|uniref:Aspartic proteinase nepenthesin-1 n=1 Tax=Sesamum alatum TaxID=300844 RepID=A0AAE1Z0E4_9LAMI|nr:Aspartic proteinase nepenthesin-1 [Sesamum alatum]
MARKLPFLLFISLQLALLPYSQCWNSSESAGFSLSLTRRDFPDSNSFPDVIRPGITRAEYIFTIDAGIGTPSTQKPFIFDLGSDLTWTQCTPCVNCFQQDYPLFDPKKSRTYRKLPQNHPLTRWTTSFARFKNGAFTFNIAYSSGQSSTGVVSIDTFSFPSHRRGPESIPGVVFGCANNQQGYFSSMVTGVMGMNRSPVSFIGQMGSLSERRFSYCLPSIDSPVKTIRLRFGGDIKKTDDLHETSFLNTRDHSYRVKLLGISVAGRRLRLPFRSFSKGCTLDTGCAVSRIETRVYKEVERVLIQHFSGFNLTRQASGSIGPGDLCYSLRPGFGNYPNMTFHFQGADYGIGPKNLFLFRKNRFCLAMFRDEMTILGAYQQQNVRFVYDVGSQKVLFREEDCSKDRA